MRMSRDVPGPLSGITDGATANAQVANACLPAGQRTNKTPILISGVSDTRYFLACLRASCLGGLTSQLKGEQLMVVSSTADRFRAVVGALRSLDGKDDVSFHTFTLPENRCARLLFKNVGRGTPQSVVQEELKSLNIRILGVTHLRSGRRDQDPVKEGLPTPNFTVPVARGTEVSKVWSHPNSAACECWWNRTWFQKAPCNVSAASASDTCGLTADMHPGASYVGAPTYLVDAVGCENSLSAVAAGKTTRRTTMDL